MTAGAPHGRCRRIHFGLKRSSEPIHPSRLRGRGPTNPGGATPMSVYGLLLRRIVWPINDRSPLNTRCQNACEMTATRTGDPMSIFVRHKPAADGHLDTQNVEVVAAHELAGEWFRLTVRIQRDGHFAYRPPVTRTSHCPANRNSQDRTSVSRGYCRMTYRRRRGVSDLKPEHRAEGPRRRR